MILALVVCLQLPAHPPTVGDTIWLERSVAVPPGAEVRAAAWEPDGDIGLLGKPVVRREGGTAIVAYPAVAWTTGTHTILVPGPILIGQDGTTDSLPAESRTLEVASVLPVDQAPERVAVQPEVGIVAEPITTPWPLVATLLAAGLLFAPLAWWWRRRGPAMPARGASVEAAVVPLAEWGEAGEARAVAAVAAHALRATILTRLPGAGPGLVTARLLRVLEEQRPKWPTADLGRILTGLDAAQFAAHPTVDVLALVAEAAALQRQVEEAA